MKPVDFLKLTRTRILKDVVSFIQIGANDGVINDYAVNVVNQNDIGFFLEPMIKPFDLLIKNKSDYTNSKFFNKAILPEILNGHNTMNVLSEDDFNQGSSFGNTVDYRIIDKISVDTIMVKDFIDENKIKDIDYIFCDAEGIDHLIINDFLKYLTPNVLFFETCSWRCQEGVDANLTTTNGEDISIPSNDSQKKKLEDMGYYVIDFCKIHESYSEDMVAIKKELLYENN